MLKDLFEYAAVNGKIHAMLGCRMSPQDFDQLTQAKDVAEAAQTLSAGRAWGPSLAGADLQQIGRVELERLLYAGLAREYDKLAAFASKGMRGLLRALASKVEAQQILRFLRLLSAGRPSDFALSLPQEAMRHSRVRFEALKARPDYAGLLEAAAGTIFEGPLAKAAPKESQEFDYLASETAVHAAYYRAVLESVAQGFQGEDRRRLEEYFLQQCDFANIVRIMRLKKHFQTPGEQLPRYLLPFGSRLKDKYLKELVQAPGWDEAMDLLRRGPYRKVFRQNQSGRIEDYAFGFGQPARAQLRRGRPSAFDGVAYLEIKENELKNIVNVIECIRYQMPPEQIPSYLTPIY